MILMPELRNFGQEDGGDGRSQGKVGVDDLGADRIYGDHARPIHETEDELVGLPKDLVGDGGEDDGPRKGEEAFLQILIEPTEFGIHAKLAFRIYMLDCAADGIGDELGDADGKGVREEFDGYQDQQRLQDRRRQHGRAQEDELLMGSDDRDADRVVHGHNQIDRQDGDQEAAFGKLPRSERLCVDQADGHRENHRGRGENEIGPAVNPFQNPQGVGHTVFVAQNIILAVIAGRSSGESRVDDVKIGDDRSNHLEEAVFGLPDSSKEQGDVN